jgi:dipeptidyl aminopeptidase/acylaminoacyl peptidase
LSHDEEHSWLGRRRCAGAVAAPRALLEVKRLHDPQIHPDGQRVAFTVAEADFDDSRWVSHIWITEWLSAESGETAPGPSAGAATNDADQEEPLTPEELTRQLTFSPEGESDPLWSPDGRYLAFVSARPDPSATPDDDEDDAPPVAQIWALPMDGGEARKVTDSREPILDFAWTPDSSTILYVAHHPRPRPAEAIHKERTRRKTDPIVEHDDARLRQFWSIPVEERKPRLLFTADQGVEGFALSPEGSRIAYLTNYTGEENDYHIADLYLRDLEAGTTIKLVRREGGKYRLRWSPSGGHLAFLSWHDPALSYSRESVYIVEAPSAEAHAAFARTAGSLTGAPPLADRDDADGGAPLPLDIGRARARIEAPGIAECTQVSDLDRDVISYEWLDESTLLALAAEGTGTALYRLPAGPVPGAAIAVDGNAQPRDGASSPPTVSTSSTTYTGPAGEAPRPTADRRELAVHRESGCAAWVQESGVSPPEIMFREPEGSEHVLTRVNAQFAETYRAPRQETVTWRSGDGQPIEGVLTYPLDYGEGSRSPLVVQVHGGPKGRATDTLLDYAMPAVWASEGYMVLRPNFRGSEGYGNAFAVANRRDLGGGDYEDILSGVDWAIEQGLADGDRTGIMGGSYGGYMVNWAIGHTERFKAAISMFGIFDLRADYSNSRLSRWEHDYTGAYYWEDPEIYRRLSPVSYLEAIRTPTLIIHGDDDDNTSVGNSREIYRALLQRGVPTQFVHYPREGHGIQEPNHRLDELRRCLAWMDRYVRFGGLPRPVYRVGDRVADAEGRFELCVTSAEAGAFIGRPSGKDGPEALLEVVFTIQNRPGFQAPGAVTAEISHVRLEGEGEAKLLPIGVPLDLPGGKIVLEGEGLRAFQQPDPETGEIAFALAAVFSVPKSGTRLLHVLDFPPIEVHWSDDEEERPTDPT